MRRPLALLCASPAAGARLRRAPSGRAPGSRGAARAARRGTARAARRRRRARREEGDYYAILGVEREASPSEIKLAFKASRASTTPTCAARRGRRGAAGRAALDEAWRQATIAYQLLSDERLRKKYDNERRAQEVGEGISAVASVLADFVATSPCRL